MNAAKIEAAVKEMIGRKLERVDLDKSRDRITFVFRDGGISAFTTGEDCCSKSWIAHLETPGDSDGATVLAVEGFRGDGVEIDVAKAEKDGDDRYQEVTREYQTVFHTDRGDIVLEYRNSSNGYYGGWLVVAAP